MPFLENVTRGRGIPRERLEEVGEHYFRFGGRSPDQRPEPRAASRRSARTSPAPASTCRSTGATATGTRTCADAVTQMRDDGVTPGGLLRHVGAYSSYSGCRQYREDLAEAVDGLAGAPRLDRLRHYFNHPGFVEAVRRRDPDRARRAARDGARGRPPGLRHPLDPRCAMNERSGPRGGAYVGQHRSVVAEITDRVRQETGRRHPQRPRLLLAVRPAARAVARAGRQRPPRDAGRAGSPAVVVVPDRVRLRPHGGRLRPRHRGRGDRRAARRCRLRGRRRRGSTRGSSRWCATCCSSGPRPSAAAPDRSTVGSLGPRAGPVPGRLLREPARAGARRWAARDDRLTAQPACAARPGRLLDLALCGGPRGGASWCASARTARSRWPPPRPARPTWSPRSTGPARTLIRARLLAARPDDAVLGEEGGERAGSSGVRWIVDPIDGTVNFLYGLPQYADLDRRRVDGEWSPGSCSTRPPASSTPPASAAAPTRDGEPHRRTRRGPAGPAAGDHRLRLRRRPCGPARPRRSPGCCPWSATSAASARRPWTSATWPTGFADAYVEEGVHLWDHAAAALIAAGGGGDRPADPGTSGREARGGGPRGWLRRAAGRRT